MATRIEEPTLPELPPELLQAIGRAATTWASFELQLDATIWLLLAIRDANIGACVTSQIGNSGRKLDAIIALSGQRDCSQELLKELRSFANKSDGFQRTRNRIVHDVWVSTSETNYRLEMTAAKSLVFEHKPISIKEISDFSSEIMRHTSAFNILRAKMFKERSILTSLAKALQGIPPQQAPLAPRARRS